MQLETLDELLGPISFEEFSSSRLYREPFAQAATALKYRKLLGWPLLNEIFSSGHAECWLPLHGQLPAESSLKTGTLTFDQAYGAFSSGRSVLIRHAERAHHEISAIAESFARVFGDPIDLQVYATPAGQEGFDWHYDIEDVFIIQSSGEKEFRLRKPREIPSLLKVDLRLPGDFLSNFEGPEIRCHLKPGDFLYIPAGLWHKARALTPSFHASIGVMSSRNPARRAQLLQRLT